ncbi:MAG: SLC13 family permease [Planctomycetota bacterium]
MTAHPAGSDAAKPRARGLLVALGLAVVAHFAAGRLVFEAGVDVGAARRGLAVTVFVATCWLNAALPIGAASLLPLALFPLLGVQPMASVARSYSDPILWMFLGGFVLARAIERFGLHRRLALHVLVGVGLKPRRIVLGFLFAALLISMWISNTATALMLMPIGVALVDKIERQGVLGEVDARRFGVAVLLGIAYGCSVGGLGSPIGTPTNLVFFARDNFGALQRMGAPDVSFARWMLAFAPMTLVLGLVVAWLLNRVLLRVPGVADPHVGDQLRVELRGLGRMRPAERRVLMLFSATVALWVLRGPLGPWPGWASLLGLPKGFVQDGAVAVLMACVAFVVPSGERERPTLMDWPTAVQIPWDMYFLLAGGFALAQTPDATGLSRALASSLGPSVQTLPMVASLAVIVVAMTLLSEVATNVAIASLMMPVLLATARVAHVDPRALMVPATVAASFGFALPIATPPNAVVFATGKIQLRDMLRAGVVVDLACCVVLVVFCVVWAFPVLGISLREVPAWWK